jgi:hypothetical protein
MHYIIGIRGPVSKAVGVWIPELTGLGVQHVEVGCGPVRLANSSEF